MKKVNKENAALRAENEKLRQRVSDLIADSNGREIDMNAMRTSRDKLEEALRDAMRAVATRDQRLKCVDELRAKAALADEVAEDIDWDHDDREVAISWQKRYLAIEKDLK